MHTTNPGPTGTGVTATPEVKDRRAHTVADLAQTTTTTDTQTTVTDNNGNLIGGKHEATNISINSFNCHGFKASVDYIIEQVKVCDILCLCETWIRSGEGRIINDTLNTSKELDCQVTVFSKSGMDNTDPEYKGRPFGGVSIICKHQEKLSFHELETPGDRVIAVGVYDSTGAIKQVIVCAYLPFYQGGNSKSTESFTESLDILQSVIDKYGALAPLKVFGDFNVQLPNKAKLHKHWFKGKGYTKHSLMMYDFLANNNMLAMDMQSKQQVNYTYFSLKCGHYTWIDHVLVQEHDVATVNTC